MENNDNPLVYCYDTATSTLRKARLISVTKYINGGVVYEIEVTKNNGNRITYTVNVIGYTKEELIGKLKNYFDGKLNKIVEELASW